jgi:hypothetical protein
MAVDDLFLDHVVEAADFLLGVGEELHGEAVLVAEGLVREDIVAARRRTPRCRGA